MEKVPLKTVLAENLAILEDMFGDSADYYAKPIRISGVRAAIVLFDNLTALQALWNLLLESAARPQEITGMPWKARNGETLYQDLMELTDIPAEKTPAADFAAVTEKLTAGFALLLLDGCAKAVVFSVQNMKYRSISSPSAEGNIRGSQEGFTELLRVNASLLRRLIRTDSFVIETAVCDTHAKTEYAVCYDKACCDTEMVAALKRRLQAAKPPMLLDSSYFAPWLCPVKLRLFTPLGYTERPAVAAAKICEGKAVVLVNGSPCAMLVPHLFAENFTCLDDYAGTAYFAAVLRILKYLSFLLTITLPGWFVCTAVYTPELLSAQFVYKISAAESATPLPLFAEMLLVILILEIIREAGLRMPSSLGHSVSLVSALIVGDAAISAGILSTPVILIGAVTSIAMFVTPQLYEPAAVLRVVFLLSGGLAGPVGFCGAVAVLLLALCTPSLFGISYMSEWLPPKGVLLKDVIMRKTMRTLGRRPYTVCDEREDKA